MSLENKRYKIIIGILFVHIIKIVIIYMMNRDLSTNILSALISNFLIVSGIIGLIDNTYYIPEKAIMRKGFKVVNKETYYGKQDSLKQDIYILKNIITIIIGLVFFFIWA